MSQMSHSAAVMRERSVVTDVNPSSGDIIKLTITPGVTPRRRRRKSRSAGSKIASVGLPVLVG